MVVMRLGAGVGWVMVRVCIWQNTPGVLPGEHWKGFYLGEEAGGQPLGKLEA